MRTLRIYSLHNFHVYLSHSTVNYSRHVISLFIVVVQSLSYVRLFVIPWTQPIRLFCPWDFPDKNTGVGCHVFLQVISLLLLLRSRFSRVQLFVTPQTAAQQALPSLGFSRQEHWSGLPFPSPRRESEVAQSCLTLCNPMDCSPPGSSAHGIFQARILEWGAIAFSSYIPSTCLFYNWKFVPFDHLPHGPQSFLQNLVDISLLSSSFECCCRKV